LTSSLAPGAVRCRAKCRQGHRRARNRASKSEFRAPTECFQREGHTDGNANTSSRQARRSPRAIRTSRNGARENREASPASIGTGVDRAGKPKAQSGRERRRGVELGHSTCEAAEQSRWRPRPRRWWREGPGPRRTSWNLTLREDGPCSLGSLAVCAGVCPPGHAAAFGSTKTGQNVPSCSGANTFMAWLMRAVLDVPHDLLGTLERTGLEGLLISLSFAHRAQWHFLEMRSAANLHVLLCLR
jgi:hypothetical protein